MRHDVDDAEGYESQSDDESDGDPLTSQTGGGFLGLPMDCAEDGEHEAAFDDLNRARLARAPRHLFKKAEAFL